MQNTRKSGKGLNTFSHYCSWRVKSTKNFLATAKEVFFFFLLKAALRFGLGRSSVVKIPKLMLPTCRSYPSAPHLTGLRPARSTICNRHAFATIHLFCSSHYLFLCLLPVLLYSFTRADVSLGIHHLYLKVMDTFTTIHLVNCANQTQWALFHNHFKHLTNRVKTLWSWFQT